MKEIRFNGYCLEMYDSIDEMPAARFSAYNRYLLIDSGIGSDLADFDKTAGLLLRYIDKNEADNAKRIIMNMRQNLHFVIEETSPRMNAFICLICRINGKSFDDLSSENIERTLKRLSRKGLTFGKLNGFIEHVKKKWNQSLTSTFRKGKRA